MYSPTLNALPQAFALQTVDKLHQRASALHEIAGITQQLQVVDMVAATLRLGNDVIHSHIAKQEHDLAATTKALLLVIQRVCSLRGPQRTCVSAMVTVY